MIRLPKGLKICKINEVTSVGVGVLSVRLDSGKLDLLKTILPLDSELF